MIRDTSVDAAKLIDAMPAASKVILPGLEVFYLDGNHLAATEHRLAALRGTREGPLPGQSLALLDAQRGLIVELVPCEDGHAQERSLLPAMLERLRAGTVIVADRNFCTSQFFFGMATRGVYFVIRQHASTLTWKLRGKRRRLGRIATGMVHEQGMELHFQDKTLSGAADPHWNWTDPPKTATRKFTSSRICWPSKRRRAASGGDLRHALDGGRSVPNVDRRVALRGGNAGLSARGAVLVRDGRAGVQHVRGGAWAAKAGATPGGGDRGETVGPPFC